MLELISMVAGLIVCVMTPIEVGRIRKGWVRDKFKGDRPKFLAAYRKQLKMLTWLGFTFAVLAIGLASLEDHRAEAIVKVVGAAIWFAVASISFFSLRTLADVPDTQPVAGPTS